MIITEHDLLIAHNKKTKLQNEGVTVKIPRNKEQKIFLFFSLKYIFLWLPL